MAKSIPPLDYPQFCAVQQLVHECCNNDNGNCLLLDDGWDTHICAQSISRSLVCKYFRAAVLPVDRELETALIFKGVREVSRQQASPGIYRDIACRCLVL